MWIIIFCGILKSLGMRINLIKLGYEARQALARGPDVLANALVGRATVF